MIFESISVWIASWYWVAPPLTPPFLSLPLLWLLLPQGSSDQPSLPRQQSPSAELRSATSHTPHTTTHPTHYTLSLSPPLLFSPSILALPIALCSLS